MAVKINEFRVVFVLILVAFAGLCFATPTGPDSIDFNSNETFAGNTLGTIANISGGYVANFNLTAVVQNPRWKSFVGQIDGKFTLDDAGGSTVYDWDLTSVAGEVYATRTSGAVAWGSIQCAGDSHMLAENTALEHSGDDNITATFDSNNTETYVIAGTSIAAAECYSINTYVNNASQSSSFEEIALYDGSNIVYATEIEEDVTGYDGLDYDFQMLVPENGNETFSSATAYYLYVELN
jgi:hypothetical protein